MLGFVQSPKTTLAQMQLFVPVILQYCRSYSFSSSFRISLRIISKWYQEKKKYKEKCELFIFFYRQEYILPLDYTLLYMSYTGKNFSTLLLKSFLRNCKYLYLSMYTSTLNTSVMYAHGFCCRSFSLQFVCCLNWCL